MNHSGQLRGVTIVTGVLFIILGILAYILPRLTTLTTVLGFGSLLFVIGCLQGYYAFKIQDLPGRGWTFLSSALYFLLGLIFLIRPGIGVIAVIYAFIAFFLIEGIGKIALALEFRNQSGWVGFLVSGIIALFISIISVTGLPTTMIWLLGTLMAAYFIIVGLSILFLASQMPRLINRF